MAAMMATTTSRSSSVKPPCFCSTWASLPRRRLGTRRAWIEARVSTTCFSNWKPKYFSNRHDNSLTFSRVALFSTHRNRRHCGRPWRAGTAMRRMPRVAISGSHVRRCRKGRGAPRCLPGETGSRRGPRGRTSAGARGRPGRRPASSAARRAAGRAGESRARSGTACRCAARPPLPAPQESDVDLQFGVAVMIEGLLVELDDPAHDLEMRFAGRMAHESDCLVWCGLFTHGDSMCGNDNDSRYLVQAFRASFHESSHKFVFFCIQSRSLATRWSQLMSCTALDGGSSPSRGRRRRCLAVMQAGAAQRRRRAAPPPGHRLNCRHDRDRQAARRNARAPDLRRPRRPPGRRDRARAAPQAPRRIRRPGQDPRAARDLHPGRAQSQRGARPRAAVRPAGAGQDHAGTHRRRRDGGEPCARPPARCWSAPATSPRCSPTSSRTTCCSSTRSTACRRWWRRSCTRAGGLPDRHHDRRGAGGALGQARPAPLHAGRRHHPRRHADQPAARPLRDRVAAGVLHRGRARLHRRALGAPAQRRDRRRRRARDRPPRAARRASPTACCAGCATMPR